MDILALQKNLKYIETISRFFRLYRAFRSKGDINDEENTYIH